MTTLNAPSSYSAENALFNSLGAKPGELVFNKDGLAVSRINKDGTEDNRWTAEGECSMANGLIRISKWIPSDTSGFHSEVESKPNSYILKGYTLFYEVCALPVEVWALKAAELLDGEFNDLQDLLSELSKNPEKERQAKLTALRKLFGGYKKKPTLSKKAKEDVDEFFEDYEENIRKHLYSHEDVVEFLTTPARDFGSFTHFNDASKLPDFRFMFGLWEFRRLNIDWYKLWRKLRNVRARKTPELRRYFYECLERKLNDKSINRVYRDLQYARRVCKRLLQRDRGKISRKRRMQKLEAKLEELKELSLDTINDPGNERDLHLVKRTQAIEKLPFKPAMQKLNADRLEERLRRQAEIDSDEFFDEGTDYFQEGKDALEEQWKCIGTSYFGHEYDHGQKVWELVSHNTASFDAEEMTLQRYCERELQEKS